MDMNDQAFSNWDFNHVDPTGAQTNTRATLYTAGDLAASMEMNPYLKVFCANGYYDAATPFFQTQLDIENMPLGDQKTKEGRENRRKTLQHHLFFHTYHSGHMIYLDDKSRKEMKNELGKFYDKIHHHPTEDDRDRRYRSLYRRRFSRTPY